MFWQKCLLLLGFGIAFVICQSSQCYFPDGSKAFTYEPCDEFAFTSFCCPYGWTCFSGKVCVVTLADAVNNVPPVGTVSRGACTDSEWEEGVCGEFCLDSGSDGQLIDCSGNRYCCAADESNGICDCDTGEGTFYKELGTADVVIGLPSADPNAALTTSRRRTSITTRITPSTRALDSTFTRSAHQTATVRTSVSSEPSISSTDDSSSQITSSTSRASASASASSSISPTTADQQQGGAVTQMTAFKAGVGIGASAAGIIVGLILFLCVRSYRHRDGDAGSIDTTTSPSGGPKHEVDLREQEVMLGQVQDRSDYSIAPHPLRSQARTGAIRWTSSSGQGPPPNNPGYWPSHPGGGLAFSQSKGHGNQRARKSFPQPRYSMLRPVSEVSEPPSKPNTPIPFDKGGGAPSSPVSPISTPDSPQVSSLFTIPRRPLPNSAYHAPGLPRASS